MFTDRDMEASYDEEASTVITLSGSSASSDSDAVSIDGSTVTISGEGTYILEGTLTDGMIIVDTEDSDKVQLVLDGVNIANADSAAIYARGADKVFVTTASGTENTLSNGGTYTAIDDNNIDSVIFSKSDLTLNGEGTLTIDAEAGHGIVSKDDLVLTSGTYDITAEKHALSGKDSVRIAGGTYTLTAGKDGINASNDDDTTKGFVYIADGTFTFDVDDDAVHADNYLTIRGGDFDIKSCYEGLEGLTVTIDDGTYDITSSDDGINAAGGNDNSGFNGPDGNKSGDMFGGRRMPDGMNSSAAGGSSSGSADSTSSGTSDTSASETTDTSAATVVSYTDTVTSASETAESSAGASDSSDSAGSSSDSSADTETTESSVVINGGTFTIVSDGDCIDSNGSLYINGGTLNLTCNGNGNTALDCNGDYQINGDVTTNDGSEENPSEMSGGGAGMKSGMSGGRSAQNSTQQSDQ